MATTPILNLPVAIGVDNSYWVPVASTATNQTERANVQTISGIQGSLDGISTVQGAVLYRGSARWEGLALGRWVTCSRRKGRTLIQHGFRIQQVAL